jgi:hypothetical protein
MQRDLLSKLYDGVLEKQVIGRASAPHLEAVRH